MERSDDILKRVFPGSKKDKPVNTTLEDENTDTYFCPACCDRGIILDGDVAVPCDCMKEKKISNSFKYARMSRELIKCRFDSFDYGYYKNTAKGEQEHYLNAKKALKASQDFCQNVIKNPHEIGLLFTGDVGSGKTFLAAAIANCLLEHQKKLLFLVVPDLLDELRASYNANSDLSEFDLLDIARTVPILILDDLGAHNYTDWSRNRIYSILNYRMNELLPTIITTNLDLTAIDDYLGERTSSRLLQMCRVFRLSVEKDIRLQKYEKREKIK